MFSYQSQKALLAGLCTGFLLVGKVASAFEGQEADVQETSALTLFNPSLSFNQKLICPGAGIFALGKTNFAFIPDCCLKNDFLPTHYSSPNFGEGQMEFFASHRELFASYKEEGFSLFRVTEKSKAVALPQASRDISAFYIDPDQTALPRMVSMTIPDGATFRVIAAYQKPYSQEAQEVVTKSLYELLRGAFPRILSRQLRSVSANLTDAPTTNLTVTPTTHVDTVDPANTTSTTNAGYSASSSTRLLSGILFVVGIAINLPRQ